MCTMFERQFHLFRMLGKYLPCENYVNVRQVLQEPPSPLYAFVPFIGYQIPPSERTYVLNCPLRIIQENRPKYTTKFCYNRLIFDSEDERGSNNLYRVDERVDLLISCKSITGFF